MSSATWSASTAANGPPTSTKWERQLARIEDVYRRNSRVVIRKKGIVIEGEALGAYLVKVRRRVAVIPLPRPRGDPIRVAAPATGQGALVMKSLTIKSGDRFTKVHNPEIVWVVEHPVTLADMQPHFRLAEEKRRARKMTLSESALLDRNLHRRHSA